MVLGLLVFLICEEASAVVFVVFVVVVFVVFVVVAVLATSC